ncbi:hypothetical protein Tco_0562161 [Tanacetum coccineum]
MDEFAVPGNYRFLRFHSDQCRDQVSRPSVGAGAGTMPAGSRQDSEMAKDYAIIRPLKGVAHKYGDYVCFSVLEVCEELRIKDPYLFDKRGPQDIAERIKKMLIDGMDTWAPRIFDLKRRARAIFVFPANTIAIAPDMNADMVRAHFIRDALMNMFFILEWMWAADFVMIRVNDDATNVGLIGISNMGEIGPLAGIGDTPLVSITKLQ